MKSLLFAAVTAAVLLFAGIACQQPAGPPVSPTPAVTATQAPSTKPTATSPPAAAQATPRPTEKPKPPTGVPFYQGKTIEIISASPAGGGTDTVARIVASYLPKYIPGNPKMVVRNQPGAQGAMGANIFFEKGKPDGLFLMENSSGAMSLQLKKEAIVKYDLTRLPHIGNVSRAESVLLVRKGLKGRLTDPGAQPLVCGTGEGTETWQSMTLWGKEFLGWNIRWVSGFAGSSEMELPFRRGELDMFGTSNAFIIRRILQEGIGEAIGTMGTFKGGKFERRPDFPDIPTFEEILGDKKPTGLPWQAYMVWIGPSMVDKFLSAPRGTPDSIVSILTDAYARMARDPGFDAMVRKTVSEVYEVNIGKEVDGVIKAILDVPPEAIKYGQDLQIKHGIISK